MPSTDQDSRQSADPSSNDGSTVPVVTVSCVDDGERTRDSSPPSLSQQSLSTNARLSSITNASSLKAPAKHLEVETLDLSKLSSAESLFTKPQPSPGSMGASMSHQSKAAAAESQDSEKRRSLKRGPCWSFLAQHCNAESAGPS